MQGVNGEHPETGSTDGAVEESGRNETVTGARSQWPVTRRHLLRMGAGIGSAGIAGCQFLSDGDSGPPDSTGTSPQPPTKPTDAPATTLGATTSRRPTDTETPVGTVRIEDESPVAVAEALRVAEENPGSTIEFASGTYRLDGRAVGREQPHTHFTAVGLTDVTIEGNDALLVLTDPTVGALGFFGCDRVTLRNLRVDYDPPPMTQASIEAVDEAAGTVDVELLEGFPTFESPALSHPDLSPHRRFLTVHDPVTGDFGDDRSGGATTLRFDRPEPLGHRRYRLVNVRPMRGLAAGRHVVVVARLPFKHGIMLFDCLEPTVEHVRIHMAPAFSVLAGLCEGPVFRDVTLAPRPDGDRYVGSVADGIHVLGCAPGPTIEDCHAERLQDDAYVVAAAMNRVESVADSRAVQVRPRVGTRIRPGDTLEAIGADFERRGKLPRVTAVETTRLRLPGEWGWPARVTFESAIDDTLATGAFLRNVSRANQGFTIRNCVSRDVRSRHIRVTSRDGTIERNDLDGCAFPAIMLAGGTFSWSQAPPENVTVRNNTISRAGLNGFTTPFLGAIDAWIHLGRWRAGPRPAGRPIRELTIVGNTISRAAFAGVHVNDADGVAIRHNSIEDPNLAASAGDNYAIGLVNTSEVSVTGNSASGDGAALDQFGHRVDTQRLETRENTIEIEGQQVTPKIVQTDAGE